jgi:hypothetical protein
MNDGLQDALEIALRRYIDGEAQKPVSIHRETLLYVGNNRGAPIVYRGQPLREGV